MKHIKQYKIFESDSISLSDKVKECFLPVIDIMYNNFKINANASYVQVHIDILRRGSDELTDEIIDGIYHLEAFDLEVRGAYVKYSAKIKGYEDTFIMDKEFNTSNNVDIEGDFITYLSLLDSDRLIQVVLYITPM